MVAAALVLVSASMFTRVPAVAKEEMTLQDVSYPNLKSLQN